MKNLMSKNDYNTIVNELENAECNLQIIYENIDTSICKDQKRFGKDCEEWNLLLESTIETLRILREEALLIFEVQTENEG